MGLYSRSSVWVKSSMKDIHTEGEGVISKVWTHEGYLSCSRRLQEVPLQIKPVCQFTVAWHCHFKKWLFMCTSSKMQRLSFYWV